MNRLAIVDPRDFGAVQIPSLWPSVVYQILFPLLVISDLEYHTHLNLKF
jgi:hypothetical protein